MHISEIWSNPHRANAFVAKDDCDRIAVLSLSGEQLSVVFSDAVGFESVTAAIHRLRDQIVLSVWNEAVVAYRWGGDLLWKHTGWKEIESVQFIGDDHVAVLQMSGKCRLLDANTGVVQSEHDHVRAMGCAPDSPNWALVRDHPRRHELVVQLGNAASGEMLTARPYPFSDPPHSVVFGAEWICMAENGLGGLATYSLDGRECWGYVSSQQLKPSSGSGNLQALAYLSPLVVTNHGQEVFVIKRSFEKDAPDTALFFNGLTGEIIREILTDVWRLSLASVAEGTLLVAHDSVVHLPSLQRERRDFKILP